MMVPTVLISIRILRAGPFVLGTLGVIGAIAMLVVSARRSDARTAMKTLVGLLVGTILVGWGLAWTRDPFLFDSAPVTIGAMLVLIVLANVFPRVSRASRTARCRSARGGASSAMRMVLVAGGMVAIWMICPRPYQAAGTLCWASGYLLASRVRRRRGLGRGAGRGAPPVKEERSDEQG